MATIRLLLSNSCNPWFNLSFEEYMFKNMPKKQSILFLWRNQNTIVIGRSQNAWKECNTRRMKQDNIILARRSSGGGAVFHDLGNICFTFMSTQKNYNKNISTTIVLNSLHNLGIDAFLSGRNDILINTNDGQKKISGSAYRETNDRQLHHGTLLLNVDINKLTYYLNPDQKKLKTKGIRSIKSRVTNLKKIRQDLNYEKIYKNLKQSFFQYHDTSVCPEIITPEKFFEIPEFVTQFNKQRLWNWNFGNTPIFTHQLNNHFNWGNITLHLNIKKGIISDSKIFTDSLNPEPIEKLNKKLIGVPYNIDYIQNRCNKFVKSQPRFQQELFEVSHWLFNTIK